MSIPAKRVTPEAHKCVTPGPVPVPSGVRGDSDRNCHTWGWLKTSLLPNEMATPYTSCIRPETTNTVKNKEVVQTSFLSPPLM